MDEKLTFPLQAPEGYAPERADTITPLSSRIALIHRVSTLATNPRGQQSYWSNCEHLQLFNDKLILRLWTLLELTDHAEAKRVVSFCIGSEECDPRLLTLILDNPERADHIAAIINERKTYDYDTVSTVFRTTAPLSGGTL
jgi:hypothetical protein